MPVLSALPVSPAADARATRAERRAASVERLLDALEEIVRQHRADGRLDLDADLITGEVARHLAQARTALQRVPR